MFDNHAKLFPCVNGLGAGVTQPTQPAAPHCTFSRARSAEEKLTGVLIILSILALILTL